MSQLSLFAKQSNPEIPVSERLILSLYDHSGAWSQPYVDAGYPVIRWDKKIEGDILSEEAFAYLTQYSDSVYGILSATPCTYFAASGARWWPRIPDEDLTIMIALAQMVLVLKEQFDNLHFWVQENPVGRIDKLIPELKPFRQMSFDPCDYGDPYTKKTILWGEFNTRLYKTPVLPLYGSMMHKIPSGPKQAELRSATPVGFSKAFFQANR